MTNEKMVCPECGADVFNSHAYEGRFVCTNLNRLECRKCYVTPIPKSKWDAAQCEVSTFDKVLRQTTQYQINTLNEKLRAELVLIGWSPPSDDKNDVCFVCGHNTQHLDTGAYGKSPVESIIGETKDLTKECNSPKETQSIEAHSQPTHNESLWVERRLLENIMVNLRRHAKMLAPLNRVDDNITKLQALLGGE